MANLKSLRAIMITQFTIETSWKFPCALQVTSLLSIQRSSQGPNGTLIELQRGLALADVRIGKRPIGVLFFICLSLSDVGICPRDAFKPSLYLVLGQVTKPMHVLEVVGA